MSELAIAPLLVTLVTGTVALLLKAWPRLQRAASVAGTVGYAAVVGLLVWEVVFAENAQAVVTQLGGWRPPFGIVLVADALAVFMLGLTAIVGVYAVVFSVLYLDDETQRTYYHPLFQFLLLGATGAFLTGDLFNLFVWFEVMLMVSYVFVAFYADARHTAAAMRYVVLNVLGGLCMLLAVGGLYATLGTLNMADMAQQVADTEANLAPVVGLSAFLFVTFALKAGLVPFQFWVPSAYRAAPLPVVAMFAGVTKKVGVYAIIRVYFTVFGDASVSTSIPVVTSESVLAVLAPVLLVTGVLSVLVGGVGAVNRDTLDELLAYSSIGQVGFIVVPVALAAGTAPDPAMDGLRHLGILAGVLFALHHALTKGLLFLSVAVINDWTGTTQIADLGGLLGRSPGFASVFLVGGLSLVGIPPLAGFFGKFLVFDAAVTGVAQTLAAGGGVAVGTVGTLFVLLAGAVLTILYSTRAWIGSFWGDSTEVVGTADTYQVALLATLAAIIVAVGLGFEPVYQAADAAAEAALDTEGYVEIVDPSGGESK
jgi:multicomponent Na+:H+ antiporter subunit D